MEKKNIQARVMVLMHDKSSQCALQMHEVSSNIFNGYQVVEWIDFVTDEQTDMLGKTYPDPEGGRPNDHHLLS